MIMLKWPKPGITQYSVLVCLAFLATSALAPNLPAGLRSVVFTTSGFGGLLLSLISIATGVLSARRHGALNGTAMFLGILMLVIFAPVGWLLIIFFLHEPASSTCMTLC